MANRRDALRIFLGGLLVPVVGNRALACRAAPCGPTGRTTAGPFYVRNAPATANINRLGAPGTALRIAGCVLGTRDGVTPLARANVELWHADAKGRYHPENSGDASRYPPEAINLRGRVVCDADGKFEFRSIVPAHYGNRRRHLHWRIVAPGHDELVTQTYWIEEKGTARERGDPVDRDPESCRWIEFRPEAGGQAGDVVFVLVPAS